MLESSETDFVTRFGRYAATGTLYPQREGSPLLEFAAGGRVLYLFDRIGPYVAQPGPAQVVVHGVLDDWQPEENGPEELQVVEVSAARGRGQVLAAEKHFVVVQARVPLVLGSYAPLPRVAPGSWISFGVVAPLHGFWVSGAAAGTG